MHYTVQSIEVALRRSSEMQWRSKLQLLRWSRLIMGWVFSLWVQDAVSCRLIINNDSSQLALLLLLHPHFNLLIFHLFLYFCLFLGRGWKDMSPWVSILWIPWHAEGPAAEGGPSQCPKQQCKHYLCPISCGFDLMCVVCVV